VRLSTGLFHAGNEVNSVDAEELFEETYQQTTQDEEVVYEKEKPAKAKV
jgi:hypothetical protein